MITCKSATPDAISSSQLAGSVSGAHPCPRSPSSADAVSWIPDSARMTPREFEVLTLLAEGLPNKLIARRLQISANTVKCHIASILGELAVESRLQAVVAAYRGGLIDTSGAEAACPGPARPISGPPSLMASIPPRA